MAIDPRYETQDVVQILMHADGLDLNPTNTSDEEHTRIPSAEYWLGTLSEAVVLAATEVLRAAGVPARGVARIRAAAALAREAFLGTLCGYQSGVGVPDPLGATEERLRDLARRAAAAEVADADAPAEEFLAALGRARSWRSPCTVGLAIEASKHLIPRAAAVYHALPPGRAQTLLGTMLWDVEYQIARISSA